MKNIIKFLLVAVMFILATSYNSEAQVKKRLAPKTGIEQSTTLQWSSGVWYGKNQRVTFALEVETTSALTKFAGTINMYGSWNNLDWDPSVASATFTMTAATNRTVEAISVSDFTYPFVKCAVTTSGVLQTVTVIPMLFSVDK